MMTDRQFRLRFTVLVWLVVLTIAVFMCTAESRAASPVPASTFYASWTWDCAGNTAIGDGDLWGTAWHSDDTLLTAWGDDKGFQGTTGTSFGFAFLAGSPPSVTGTDISEWCLTDAGAIGPACANQGGKPEGTFLALNDVIYFVMDTQGTGDDYAFAYSADKFTTAATYCSTTFPDLVTGANPEPQPGVPIGGFVSFGQNNADAIDGFLYVVTSGHIQGRTEDFSEDVGLMRITAPTLGNEADICDPPDGGRVYARWEFLSGPDVSPADGILDVGATPTWSSDRDDQIAIFSDPATVARPDIVYNPAIDRYTMIMNHNTGGNAKPDQRGLGVFDAPDPWGPWTTVYYSDTWCQTQLGLPNDSFPLTCHIQPKWRSPDGLTNYCTWSTGGSTFDRFNVMKATATLAAGCGDGIVSGGEVCDTLDSPPLNGLDCTDFPTGTAGLANANANPGGGAVCNPGCAGVDTRGCDDSTSGSSSPDPPYDPWPNHLAAVANWNGSSTYAYDVLGEGKNDGLGHARADAIRADIDANSINVMGVSGLGDNFVLGGGAGAYSVLSTNNGAAMRKDPWFFARGDQDEVGRFATYFNLPGPDYYFDIVSNTGHRVRYIFMEYDGFGNYPDATDIMTKLNDGTTATLQDVLEGNGAASPQADYAIAFGHIQWVVHSNAGQIKGYVDDCPNCSCPGGVCRSSSSQAMRTLFENNNVRVVFQADNAGMSVATENGVTYIYNSFSRGSTSNCTDPNHQWPGMNGQPMVDCSNGAYAHLEITGDTLHVQVLEAFLAGGQNILHDEIIIGTGGQPACDDGIDNDGDGFCDTATAVCTDPTVVAGDAGCVDDTDTTELSTDVCDDGLDNDLDLLSDFRLTGGDPGCVSLADTSEREATGAECDNTTDDETVVDGLIDYPADPGCLGPTDILELAEAAQCLGAGDPWPCCTARFIGASCQIECDDGVDNDTDTFIDTDDPDCIDAFDQFEGPTPAAQALPIINGDNWTYLLGSRSGASPNCVGTPALPPANWETNGFNDGAWGVGPGGFGFGVSNGDCINDRGTVVLDLLLNGDTVLYIRKTFDIPVMVTELTMWIAYDDSYVCFINGVEAARVNVPAGQTCDTSASATHECGTANASYEGAVGNLNGSVPDLVVGTNTIACELHNRSTGSSDIFIDVLLDAGAAGSPQCDDGLDNDNDGFCDLVTSTCTEVGVTPGDTGCNDLLDTTEAECGDGFLDAGEPCDPGPPEQLNGQTCVGFDSLLYSGGTIACQPDCSDFDPAGCTLIPGGTNSIQPSTPEAVPSFETIGYSISFQDDDNGDATVTVEYRPTGGTYQDVHRASRTPDRSAAGGLPSVFAGRIFWLSEGTSYDIKWTFNDPDGVNGPLSVEQTVVTKTTPVAVTSNTFYIDPVLGLDTNPGTSGNPWQTMASVASGGVNELLPGDTLIMRDGVYDAVEFSIDNSGTGSATSWIQFKADTGATPIIDGSDPALRTVDAVSNWFPNPTYPRMFDTTINYPDISGGVSRVSWDDPPLWLAHYLQDEGHSLTDLANDLSGLGHGWFLTESTAGGCTGAGSPWACCTGAGAGAACGDTQGTLTVWLPGSTDVAPIDPDTVEMWVPRTHFLMRVSNSDYVEIDGVTFRWGYRVLSLFGSSNSVVRNSHAYGAVYPFETRNAGSGILWEDNLVESFGVAIDLPPQGPKTDLYEWFKHNYPVEHQGFKVVDAGGPHVFRNNTVRNVFNGGIWEDGTGTELTHLEIYDNIFRDILDDAMEPEGELFNTAIWGNRIEGALAGISGAPISVGPIFIMYNYILDHSIRSLKFNHGNCTNCGEGEWFIYHNTMANAREKTGPPDTCIAAGDPAACCTGLGTGNNCDGLNEGDGDGIRVPGFSQGMVTEFRNNIFAGWSRAIDDSNNTAQAEGKTRSLDWDGLWAYCNPGCLETNGEARFVKWTNENYPTMIDFQTGSCGTTTGCQEANGIHVNPEFVDVSSATAKQYDVRLCHPSITGCDSPPRTSQMIDAGIVIQGINDIALNPNVQQGLAPDLGASEFNNPAPVVCGDALIEAPEECEPLLTLPKSCTTIPGGFTGGTLACFPVGHAEECMFDESGCTSAAVCGNGDVEAGEECDPPQVPLTNCVIEGFYCGSTGALPCDVATCLVDVTTCVSGSCGDNIRQCSEVCDGTDLVSKTCQNLYSPPIYDGGTLSCLPGCNGYDETACTTSSELGVKLSGATVSGGKVE